MNKLRPNNRVQLYDDHSYDFSAPGQGDRLGFGRYYDAPYQYDGRNGLVAQPTIAARAIELVLWVLFLPWTVLQLVCAALLIAFAELVTFIRYG